MHKLPFRWAKSRFGRIPSTAAGVLAILLLYWLPLQAQEPTGSPLFRQLKAADSLVFDLGFNQCDLVTLRQMLHRDLEFVHDQNGSKNRKGFLRDFTQSICANADAKPIRKLVEGSVTVFPLYNEGNLYGALQMGQHDFYLAEPGQPLRPTATGSFIHTWLQVKGEWQLWRVVSYAHTDRQP